MIREAQDARPLPQAGERCRAWVREAYLPHGAHGASIDSPHLTEELDTHVRPWPVRISSR